MEKISVCRVCLGKDIGLKCIIETHLQEMYESLVLMPFKTEDTRPIMVCYICCARLQNCYELRRSCLRSEELFIELSCDELSLETQHEHYKKRLTQVYNVVKLSMGDVLQMNADNVDVDTLTLNDVKLEQNGTEGEVSPMYSEQAVQTSSKLKQHQLVQDKLFELNKVTAADKPAATSTNEVTFTFNDNNKERCTSVPHSKRVQYTCDTCQQCYTSECKLESHIASCSQVFNKHLSRDNTTSGGTLTARKQYQCNICNKQCACNAHLKVHICTHTGEKPYRCNICNKHFSQNYYLKKHMRTHTGEKPYRCDICNKHFSQNCHLKEHMRLHTGEKPYTCDICNKTFARSSYLSVHNRTHTGEKRHRSDICTKHFSQKNNLNSHMQTHSGEKPYRCNICIKQFSKKVTLVEHMRTHTGEKPYPRKKTFPCKRDLNVHNLIQTDILEDALEENSVYDNSEAADSDDEPLIVVKEEQSRDSTSEVSPMYSEQAVQTSSKLQQHQLVQDKLFELNKVTAADKPAATSTNEVTFTLNDNNKERCTSVPHSKRVQYTCDTCQQCYTSECKLESHIASCSQVFNKHLSRDNTTSGGTLTARKQYQCYICNKQYSYSTHLKVHMRTHTGEKPYRCDICNKHFSHKSNLKSHIRSHTGEKLYTCDICNKHFSRKSILNLHILTHTGEKAYRCDICNKHFSLKGNLNSHIRTHTGEKPYTCDICKKSFSQRSNLKVHLRTHTGEKPYLCNKRKKSFPRTSALIVHNLTHTG